MAQEEEVVWSLRVRDRIDGVAQRRELKGRVALFLATAGVAMGLVSFSGSWLGLLAFLAAPYFLWKMVRAQRELRMLEEEGEI